MFQRDCEEMGGGKTLFEPDANETAFLSVGEEFKAVSELYPSLKG